MLFVFLLEYNFYSQFFRNGYIHLKINKITYWSKTINKKPLKEEILINNPVSPRIPLVKILMITN